jgi:hypothetical protein
MSHYGCREVSVMAKTTGKPHKPDAQREHSVTSLAPVLRQVANCMGYIVLQMSDYKDKADTERIPFLGRLGFHRNDIAGILGTTPGTVSKQLSITKASERGKKRTGKASRPDAKD